MIYSFFNDVSERYIDAKRLFLIVIQPVNLIMKIFSNNMCWHDWDCNGETYVRFQVVLRYNLTMDYLQTMTKFCSDGYEPIPVTNRGKELLKDWHDNYFKAVTQITQPENDVEFMLAFLPGYFADLEVCPVTEEGKKRDIGNIPPFSDEMALVDCLFIKDFEWPDQWCLEIHFGKLLDPEWFASNGWTADRLEKALKHLDPKSLNKVAEVTKKREKVLKKVKADVSSLPKFKRTLKGRGEEAIDKLADIFQMEVEEIMKLPLKKIQELVTETLASPLEPPIRDRPDSVDVSDDEQQKMEDKLRRAAGLRTSLDALKKTVAQQKKKKGSKKGPKEGSKVARKPPSESTPKKKRKKGKKKVERLGSDSDESYRDEGEKAKRVEISIKELFDSIEDVEVDLQPVISFEEKLHGGGIEIRSDSKGQLFVYDNSESPPRKFQFPTYEVFTNKLPFTIEEYMEHNKLNENGDALAEGLTIIRNYIPDFRKPGVEDVGLQMINLWKNLPLLVLGMNMVMLGVEKDYDKREFERDEETDATAIPEKLQETIDYWRKWKAEKSPSIPELVAASSSTDNKLPWDTETIIDWGFKALSVFEAQAPSECDDEEEDDMEKAGTHVEDKDDQHSRGQDVDVQQSPTPDDHDSVSSSDDDSKKAELEVETDADSPGRKDAAKKRASSDTASPPSSNLRDRKKTKT